jgi:SAM-dependent methyltransferase
MRRYPEKTLAQKVLDLLFAPLRLTVLPDPVMERLGLTSLQEERLRAVLPRVRGRLLDIGCGNNKLAKIYGHGVGVDVYDWGGGALILPDCSCLPFPDGSFDTVTIIAALNHIPNRKDVLQEAYRLLAPDGQIIITMINPLLSFLGHRFIWWYDEGRERGMDPEEVYGFWNKDLVRLVESARFNLFSHQRFFYALNNLFVFRKDSPTASLKESARR